MLLDFDAGVEAEQRLERLAKDGLIVAWQLADDENALVDILVGKKLTSAQKAKAEWWKPQAAYLNVPSGSLRLETLNSLSISPDDTDDVGYEFKVPAGEYDLILDRVARELMDGTAEQHAEIPTDILSLHPVRKKGPRKKRARLLIAEALGELGPWLKGGQLQGLEFHGTGKRVAGDDSFVFVNMRASHAQQIGLQFGKMLEITAADTTLVLPFIGYLSELGLAEFFGSDWYEKYLAEFPHLCGFSLFSGSPPWLLQVAASQLPPGVDVTAKPGQPWCDIPDSYPGDYEVGKGHIAGRIVWVSANSIILNFGWEQWRRAKFQNDDVLELVWEENRRVVYSNNVSGHSPLIFDPIQIGPQRISGKFLFPVS
ncbi:MAG: hypothetical protein KZQ58_03985, partial [gamma proteobacterium symbiont of Bathyaustriella thionipta]|nr:hypothetical protein [gamma proteobacterium symbiont of Bathyaustriella thionipta]